MKDFENTFVRGPSPSYSDENSSDNAMSATLPIGTVDSAEIRDCRTTYLDEKFNCIYDDGRRDLNKGRDTFAFWTVITILLILTVGNLFLTLTIIGVLHLGKGIHGMELIPEEDLIRFYGSTDLDRVYSKAIGDIEGFLDEPMTITGDDGSVNVRLWRNGKLQPRMIMENKGIQFMVNTFDMKDPTNGAAIFTTHHPHYNMPTGADVLIAKAISARRIASPMKNALTANAETLSIRGSEGILADGASVLFRAGHNIVINSTQGNTILEAGSGIYLDMNKIPIVSSEFGLRTGNVQYKICVCMPQGLLFRVPVPRIHNGPKVSCAHFSSDFDPCAGH